MIFINTRPAERASLLSNHVRQHHIPVYELPLLEIVPLEMDTIEVCYLKRLQQGDYAALVAVSPSAVELGLKAHYQAQNSQQTQNSQAGIAHFDPHCPIIAVGQATAQAFASELSKSELSKSELSEIEKSQLKDKPTLQILCPQTANNEGMMAMPELAHLSKNERVLIWRGRGGRRLLVNHLQANGVIVDSIEWYKRQRPVDALTHLTHLCQQIDLATNHDATSNHSRQTNDSKVCVLISSGESFEHWRNLLQEYNDSHSSRITPLQLGDFCYLVLGERLERILKQFDGEKTPLRYYRVSSLDPECIMRGLTALSEATIK